ncbi:thioredoxin domain-containing protein [Elusimicrobiota bacterium]
MPDEYIIKIRKKLFKSHDKSRIIKLIESGKIPKDALVKKDDKEAWKIISEHDEFISVFKLFEDKKKKCPKCGALNEKNRQICNLCYYKWKETESSDLKCHFHPGVAASIKCRRCNKPVCNDCMSELDGQALCTDCVREKEKDEKYSEFNKLNLYKKIRKHFIQPREFYENLPVSENYDDPIRFIQITYFIIFSAIILLQFLIQVFAARNMFNFILVIFAVFAFLIIKYILPVLITLFNYIPYYILKVLGGKGSYESTLWSTCYFSGSTNILIFAFQALMVLSMAGVFFILKGTFSDPRQFVPVFVIVQIIYGILMAVISIWISFIVFLILRIIHNISAIFASVIIYGPFVLGLVISIFVFMINVPEMNMLLKNIETMQTGQEVDTGVITRKNKDGKKYQLTKSEDEIRIIGMVDGLDKDNSYDTQLFDKHLSIAEYDQDFLVVAGNAEIQGALEFMLKEGYEILMICREIKPDKEFSRKDGVQYLYCSYMSFKGMKFGSTSDTVSKSGSYDEYLEIPEEFTRVPVELTSSNFQSAVELSYDIPVLIDFYADWCHWCKVLAPTFSKMANEMKDEVIFARVDTQKYNELARKYGVRGLPTIILIVDGDVLKVQSGAGRNEQENRSVINALLEGIYE